jgi:excinuclease ABC subunit A
LHDVGLGYVKLGQSATSLSGGEAQRVKLAEQLSKRSTGKTLYILDEPTTGLHFADVHALVEVLDRLAESGNTVLVVEHNIDVIRVADYVVELGPEGGKGGGLLVASGTPEEIADGESPTAEFVRDALLRHGRASEGTVSQRRIVKPGTKKPAAPGTASKKAPVKKTPVKKTSPKRAAK